MSSITAISSTLLLLIILATLGIFVRSAHLPTGTRWPRWGFLTLTFYLCGVLAALLVWGGDVEGVGIAAILLGLPWSALGATLLSALLPLRTGLFGASWETSITILSISAIGVNGWLAYRLGQRLAALWTSQPQPS
jgi:hypothetical protein